jgi:ATP-binding cassette subfamily B protein
MSMMRGGRGRGPKDDGPKAKFSQLFPYLREHKKNLLLAVGLSIFGAGFSLAQPVLTGQVISAVQGGKDTTWLALGLVAMIVVAGVASGWQYYILVKTGEGVVLSARRHLAARLLRLPIAEYDLRRTGDLVSRVGSDTTLLRAVLTQGLVDSVGGALVFIGSIVVMAVLDPVLLGLTLLVIVIAISSIVFTARHIRRATTKAQERVGAMAAAVERALSAIRTIRAARAEERESQAIYRDAHEAYEQGVKIAKISAAIAPIAGIAMNGAFIVVLGVGGFRVAAGQTTVANLVTFVLLLFLMVRPLGQAFGAYSSVQSALGALARIQEVITVPIESESVVKNVSTGVRAVNDIAIEFKNVSFEYANSDGGKVLNDVSIQIKRGSRVALVGPSGAGKSTILSLIERFYEPTAGTILLDGQPVHAISREDLRAQLGYVEQDAPVLAGSIRANLLLASPNATDEQLVQVLEQVNLTEVLNRHASGLDAEVGENGIMLSGGERQRLAIARTLLAAPPILLLDESTSALDGVNEQKMREAIDAVSKNRTLIVIAHRLSTVVDSDQIIVIENGSVVGVGTHSELVKSTPLYKELAKHQLLV